MLMAIGCQQRYPDGSLDGAAAHMTAELINSDWLKIRFCLSAHLCHCSGFFPPLSIHITLTACEIIHLFILVAK